jgi:hypothetical protein
MANRSVHQIGLSLLSTPAGDLIVCAGHGTELVGWSPTGKPVVPETIPTYADLPSLTVAGFAKAGASVGHPPVSEIRRGMID